MSVLIVGLSHRSAPIEILEQVALDATGSERLAAATLAGGEVSEAMVLSTCNRLEVLVEAETFHGALAHVSERLAAETGLERGVLTDHLYVHYEDRAICHIFSLACGLESLAVGEAEIIGQLRGALATAQQAGHVGTSLNPLVQQALRVAKRAHHETGIGAVSRSLVSQGLTHASTVLPDLLAARAVVVGAGAMSGLTIATLHRHGVHDVTVVNRTQERADRLAAQHGVRASSWDRLEQELGSADLLVTCTGAVGHVVDASVLTSRDTRPLAILDLALPRDVDAAVVALPWVDLWGLADLHEAAGADADAAGGLGAVGVVGSDEQEQLRQARDLVTGEVADYLSGRRAQRVGPTVAALRSRAGDVVDAELTRLDRIRPDLDERARAEVRRTVQRVVDKLLHTPTVRVKQLQAGDAGGDYAHALRELFDLDSRDVVAVASPPAQGPRETS